MRRRTLALIKPNGMAHKSEILERIKDAGFKVVAAKEVWLTRAAAEELYREHRNKGFFRDLIDRSTSGQVAALVLERYAPDGIGPVFAWRRLMGDKDPAKAESGTIRADFAAGLSMPLNLVHGPDSPEAAEREIAFFFAGIDLIR